MVTQVRFANKPRIRRFVFLLTTLAAVSVLTWYRSDDVAYQEPITSVQGAQYVPSELATTALDNLEVKGRSPANDYERKLFGNGWASVSGCDMRNRILARDLNDVVLRDDGCVVLSGSLNDPYTGKVVIFTRGESTSDDVQIDHVVALSDAWQKGAAQMDQPQREKFANDPLNLLAVDGPTNVKKSDSDAASWLPPNKSFRCRYVARQIAVKIKYQLWVTDAERDSMSRVLEKCPSQVLPVTIVGLE